MPQLDISQANRPATFRERGVSLKLTTPGLTGARVRVGSRDKVELLVPKAPGWGDVASPWASIGDLYSPCVHDSRLLRRVGALRTITPATVRDAGLMAAAEGFAGRRAQAAARQATATDQEARALTHYHLVLSLVRQANPTSLKAGALRPTALAPLAKQAIRQLAERLQQNDEATAESLTLLALLLAPLGLGERVGTARVPALLVMIQAFRQSIASMPITTAWEDRAVATITRSADITLAGLTSALADVRGLAENGSNLVGAWLADPVGTVARITRAEWLADGWAWLCQFWFQAPDGAARHQALDEVILALPVIPAEVEHWSDFGAELPRPIARNPLVEDRMSVIHTTRRNETLLALAA